ncbi:NAD(P)-binding protein [Enterobacter ludwigii]|uniref:NAD(P)-binding protein n=1 Tax=Enterobacter ludwigii TaxID=299767 RepID=UPI002FD2628E
MKGSVIIIGAGVSGLYAGTLLEKAGVDYVILEARKRTGGRVLSGQALANTPDGVHVDMGATWFWPEIQPDFAHLVHQLGLTPLPQGRPGDMLYERQTTSPAQRYPAYGDITGVVQASGWNADADERINTPDPGAED